jgi:hypothetical protein
MHLGLYTVFGGYIDELTKKMKKKNILSTIPIPSRRLSVNSQIVNLPQSPVELHILTDVSVSRGYIITSVIVRGNRDIRRLLPCVVEEEVSGREFGVAAGIGRQASPAFSRK